MVAEELNVDCVPDTLWTSGMYTCTMTFSSYFIEGWITYFQDGDGIVHKQYDIYYEDGTYYNENNRPNTIFGYGISYDMTDYPNYVMGSVFKSFTTSNEHTVPS